MYVGIVFADKSAGSAFGLTRNIALLAWLILVFDHEAQRLSLPGMSPREHASRVRCSAVCAVVGGAARCAYESHQEPTAAAWGRVTAPCAGLRRNHRRPGHRSAGLAGPMHLQQPAVADSALCIGCTALCLRDNALSPIICLQTNTVTTALGGVNIGLYALVYTPLKAVRCSRLLQHSTPIVLPLFS